MKQSIHKAFYKCIRVIRSCQSKEHFESSLRMINNFRAMYKDDVDYNYLIFMHQKEKLLKLN